MNYLVLSDIHLGHPRNKTHEILKNLETFFIEYHQEIVKCDIIFLAGDVFDRLLTTKSLEYRSVVSWLSNLLIFCHTNNIKLRILYGTPSHDCDQISAFQDIASKLEPHADFKYINTLDIEYMEDLDIHILYVPDEWRHKASDTLTCVRDLLKEKSISRVDIAVMHGCFRYQLPIVKEADFTHNEADYLDLVRYYITIGHIHTPSAYERILAPGSFDRLAHNEEEAKGALLCHIEPDRSMSFKFLKNNYAKVFKTFNYVGRSEESILKSLKKDLSKLPEASYVRLEVDNDSKLLKSVKELSELYPKIHIKLKPTDESKAIANVDILEKIKISTIEITKDNIKGLMLEAMGELTILERKIFEEEMII